MDGELHRLQNDYHRRATEFLRQALEFDEQSSRLSFFYFIRLVLSIDYLYFLDNNEMAILLYKQGIRELEKAVSLNLDPNGNMIMFLLLFI